MKTTRGYYVIDLDGFFTESSPYRHREEAEIESKEIHGDNYYKYVECYLTDAFDND